MHHRKGKETHRFIPFYSVLFMLSQFRRRHSRLSAFSILLRKVRSPLRFQVGRHPEMLFGCEAKLNLFGIFKEETQKAVNAALFFTGQPQLKGNKFVHTTSLLLLKDL